MRIVRYKDSAGSIHLGCQHDQKSVTRVEGDLFGSLKDTGQPAEVAEWLAPSSSDILCIGLNYRKHAAEGNQAIPENPVLFIKNKGALQNPRRSNRPPEEAPQPVGRLRVRAGSRHREGMPERLQGQRPRLRCRLHLCQRRRRP